VFFPVWHLQKMNLRTYRTTDLVAPKRPHKTAYAIFADEYKQKGPKEGRQKPAEVWDKLPEKEQLVYE